MVKVTIKENELFLDGYLKRNLDMAHKVIAKDWDMVFVVDGMEGSGKSVLAQHVAAYLDPTLTLDRIAFTPREFKAAVMGAERYQAVIYDEAYGGLSSRAAMTQTNRALVSMLAEIRQKNLFVVIVLPCFFELDKYVALWRSRALLHVYIGENFERGFFSFYNASKKKDLYIHGKKTYKYSIRPNFRARFVKPYMVDENAYREKKRASMEEPSVHNDESHKGQRDSIIRVLDDIGWYHQAIADACNKYSAAEMTRSGVSKLIQRAKKEEQMNEPVTQI